MNEAKFSRWLVKKLREQGWDVQRIETSTGSGVPDINCCKNGEEIWVETKCMDSYLPRLRPMQWAWMLRRVKHGGMCMVLNLCKKDDKVYLYHMCDTMPVKKMATSIKLLQADKSFDKKADFYL